jgi:hypothetical protein
MNSSLMPYKIWIGLSPRIVVHLSHTAVAIAVLYMHLWAFKALGWPESIAQKYPQYTAPAATR